MSINNLLIWMSARESGSWSQFRGAVEKFQIKVGSDEDEENEENIEGYTKKNFPIYQQMRMNLIRLGHVEFFKSNGRFNWRMVPPTIAINKQKSNLIGILCGARHPRLGQRYGEDTTVKWVLQESPGIPDCIRLLGDKMEDFERIARLEELYIQPEAPSSLLSSIPPVNDPRSRKQDEAPEAPGWTIEQFVPLTQRWTTKHHRDDRDLTFQDFEKSKTGFFRFKLNHQQFYYLRRRGRTYKVQVQVGKYAILNSWRIRDLIKYDSSQSELTIPLICKPPPLIERALILCTGFLPDLDKKTKHLKYKVPLKIARLAAGLLRQNIQIQ